MGNLYLFYTFLIRRPLLHSLRDCGIILSMILVNSIFLLAARHSDGLNVGGFLFLLAVAGGFVAYFVAKSRGNAEGEVAGRNRAQGELWGEQQKLSQDQKALSLREEECAAKEKSAQEKLTRADEYLKKQKLDADAILNKARIVLFEAKKEAENAYAAKEEELRGIVNTALSLHPNNAYIAEALTGVYDMVVRDIINELEWGAPRTAERIEKKFNENLRQLHKEARYYKLQTRLYESLFPDLLKYTDDEPGDAPPVPEKQTESDWLSDDEWNRLSPTEKSQRALDHYIASHNKSKWQIGRDYELYIGYCYRRKRYRVEHVGIQMTLADMGRDLICRSDPLSSTVETCIVQCKCWSQNKKIHEKHITQLFGTTVEYAIAHKIDLVNGRLPPCLKAVIVTSTELSDTARRFADALGVEYHERIPLPGDPNSFPRIKCNKRSGIFHLPFDEQYDVTRIVPSDGDCFVFTVAEAESKGFRRAKKYYVRNRTSATFATN